MWGRLGFTAEASRKQNRASSYPPDRDALLRFSYGRATHAWIRNLFKMEPLCTGFRQIYASFPLGTQFSSMGELSSEEVLRVYTQIVNRTMFVLIKTNASIKSYRKPGLSTVDRRQTGLFFDRITPTAHPH